MKIDMKTVEQVAEWSRLYLTEDEKQEMLEELNSLLTYIDKIGELDTANVPPTPYLTPDHNVFREDKVCESLSVEEALKNAPDHDEQFFIVPRIIEE